MAEVDLNELERYLRIFQENPDSRVFAPLADLYRRLGRLQESEEICREGILRHPYYAGGKVALGHVLLDSGRLDEALEEIDSVVTYYPDNILARKILIQILGRLHQKDRAKREFEALRALAPQVASDPELEKAIYQEEKSIQQFVQKPGDFIYPQNQPEAQESTAKMLKLKDKNTNLNRLKKKKKLLESYLRALGSSRGLR